MIAGELKLHKVELIANYVATFAMFVAVLAMLRIIASGNLHSRSNWDTMGLNLALSSLMGYHASLVVSLIAFKIPLFALSYYRAGLLA